MLEHAQIRIARPTQDLQQISDFYKQTLGFQELGRFVDHDGFDGVMIGFPAGGYHLEFTRCNRHPVQPTPTPEDLLVFYVPNTKQWQDLVDRIEELGVRSGPAFNPYWDTKGRTFYDPDGYRFVIQNASWNQTGNEVG